MDGLSLLSLLISTGISLLALFTTIAAVFAAFYSLETQKKVMESQYLSDVVKLYSSDKIGKAVDSLFEIYRKVCRKINKKKNDNDIKFNSNKIIKDKEIITGLKEEYKDDIHWIRRDLSCYLQYLLIVIKKNIIHKEDIIDYFSKDYISDLILLFDMLENEVVPYYMNKHEKGEAKWIEEYKEHFPFIQKINDKRIKDNLEDNKSDTHKK